MSRQSSWVAVAAVVAAAGFVACGSPETEAETGTEGWVRVAVQGLSSADIDHLVLTAQPANVTQTLRRGPGSGQFDVSLMLPVGVQTLTLRAYAPRGGGLDAGYPYPPYDAGYPSSSDGGPGGFDGGFDAGPGGSDGGPAGGDAGSPDAGSMVEVASGTATVTVVPNDLAFVTILLFDVTPAPPGGDIPPMIRSVQVSNGRPAVGETITLSVDAVDLDDGAAALSYLWTSECPASTFSAPTAPATTWSTQTEGPCTLQVTVSSRGLSYFAVLKLYVTGDGSQGAVEVTAQYVPRPVIASLLLRTDGCCGPPYYASSVERGGLPSPYYPYYVSVATPARFEPVTAGLTYALEVSVRFDGSGTPVIAVQDSCGGPLARLSYGGAYCSAGYYPWGRTCYESFSWTAPASGSACKLTASATYAALSDGFAAGVQVK